MTTPRRAGPDRELDRHDGVAAALHWLVGLALVGQVVFGFLLDELAPRGTPSRGAVINLHKSFGIVLGLAIVARLAWRLRHPSPPWPATMPAWQRRGARWGHGALYAGMVVLPLSGYVGSNFSRHGVRFFGRALAPWGPDLPGVYDVLTRVHDVTAWLFAALVVGHVLAAGHHALVARDGVFARVWPWRSPLRRSEETP